MQECLITNEQTTLKLMNLKKQSFIFTFTSSMLAATWLSQVRVQAPVSRIGSDLIHISLMLLGSAVARGVWSAQHFSIWDPG